MADFVSLHYVRQPIRRWLPMLALCLCVVFRDDTNWSDETHSRAANQFESIALAVFLSELLLLCWWWWWWRRRGDRKAAECRDAEETQLILSPILLDPFGCLEMSSRRLTSAAYEALSY